MTVSEQAVPVPEPPDLTERKIRQISAWIILALLLFAELGLAWDRRWHDILGRDQFWIPPHIMMYSGLGGAGLIALFVVLWETRRYHQGKAGVDDTTTVRVLRAFHAPLGFVLLGMGAFTDLLAAPLDNYWHELYGIDVTLWSPFHLMGVFGGITAGLGIIYIFASEAANLRQGDYPTRRFLSFNGPEWGLIVLFAAYQELILPALTAFTPIPLSGQAQVYTYSFILALGTSYCLIGVYLCIRKPGAAIMTALVLWLLSLFTETYVPIAITLMAQWQNLIYRVGRHPFFNITLVLLPLLFVICAVLVEYAASRRQYEVKIGLPGVWRFGLVMATLSVVYPAALTYIIGLISPPGTLPWDVLISLTPGGLIMLLALPIALLIGAVFSYLATVLGDIWYWNTQ